jgi:hypothetical protein
MLAMLALRWCFFLCEAGVRGSVVVYARLKVVHPVADEFEWSLKIEADRGGIIDAILGSFSLASLSG